MDATNVVFNGAFISRLNDYQDVYELDGVRYAVEEVYCPGLGGSRYFATELND